MGLNVNDSSTTDRMTDRRSRADLSTTDDDYYNNALIKLTVKIHQILIIIILLGKNINFF